jgi:nucleoid-associated protein YgaU
MGLFDFVKDAGEALLEKAGVGEARATAPSAPAAKKAAAPPADLAKVLIRSVKLLDIPVDDLSVQVAGDTVIVGGTSPTQADRERLILALGNTKGIAHVDDRLEVKAPEPKAVFYTVVSGDSLSKIAKAQYGAPMKYPVIFEANRPMLTDPDKIYPGPVLRIPQQ